MIKIVGCIVDGHETWLVGVAVLVCILATHTSFNLFHRALHQETGRRYCWLSAAAAVMGSGVWVTHFIAMLAYKTPWTVGYDVPQSFLSAVAAIALSGVGLWLAMEGLRALGGVVAGAAIATMHFTGMAALEGSFRIDWDWTYVVASLAVGIGFAALAFRLLAQVEAAGGRAVITGLFVLAICGLHFTAMTAATFSFDPTSPPVGASSLERQSMAIAVAAVAALLLGALEAERLRRYVSKLEATQSELEVTTHNLRMALEAAATSSQAKSQFLATMSHELRTPLNAILGFSELIKAQALGPVGNPRYLEYAADIHESGSHLLSLINDVLDFTKADAGRLELHEEELDAGELLRDCLRLVALDAREAGIEITTNLPPAAPAMLADRRRLKQIALNLLSNAMKFTPSGGKIHVALAFDRDGAAMTFADTGIGISAEEIPVALEAFGQVDNSLSRKHDGTGLGLPLCRHLAEAHGGRLTIESALGQGTTVTVQLPAHRLRLAPAA